MGRSIPSIGFPLDIDATIHLGEADVKAQHPDVPDGEVHWHPKLEGETNGYWDFYPLLADQYVPLERSAFAKLDLNAGDFRSFGSKEYIHWDCEAWWNRYEEITHESWKGIVDKMNRRKTLQGISFYVVHNWYPHGKSLHRSGNARVDADCK